MLSVSSAMAFALSGESSAMAQATEDPSEIVVTARKRAENVQNVPISIAVVRGDELRGAGVMDLQNLAPAIPGLFVTAGVALDSLQLRGIGSGVNFGFEQSVGQVIDGIFYGRSRFSRLQFLDVERVEVLKGPQGALIGKNTTAGAISIISASPTREVDGFANAGYEFAGSQGLTLQGALSGPLTDQLQVRFAALYDDHNGYVRNSVTGKRMPSNKDWITRASLAWQPLDSLDVGLRWNHGEFDRRGRSDQLAQCNGFMQAFLTQIGETHEDCRANFRTAATAPRNGAGDFNRSRTDLDTVTLSADLSLGGATLSSLSGYARYDYTDEIEGDRTRAEIFSGTLGEDYEQFSQEVRVASNGGAQFEYILGMLYQHTRQTTDFQINFDGTLFGGLPGGLNGYSSPIVTRQTGDSIAIFGQGTFNVTDSWSVTLGGRYTHEAKKARQVQMPTFIYTRTELPAALPFNRHDIHGSRKENNFSPTIDVQWKPTERTMAYASLRKGFKAGGFDHQIDDVQTAAKDRFEFAGEKVTAYEVGLKFDLAGSAYLNLAAYRSTFSNLQVSVLNSQPNSLAVFAVGNAGKAVTQGIELDGRWKPADGLTLSGAVSYLDGEFRRYDAANCYPEQTATEGCVAGVQDMKGARLPYASDWSGSASTEYRHQINDTLILSTYLQGVFASSFVLVTNQDPNLYQKAYLKLNATIGLSDPASGWTLSLVGRNLTNRITTSHGDELPAMFAGNYFRYTDPRRSVTIQLSYRL